MQIQVKKKRFSNKMQRFSVPLGTYKSKSQGVTSSHVLEKRRMDNRLETVAPV
jgi:hypothetical protein